MGSHSRDNPRGPDKQLTQPKKGEPAEIPIPTRDAFLRDLAKVASCAKQHRSRPEPGPQDEAQPRD